VAERLPAEKSDQGRQRDSLALTDAAPRASTEPAAADQGLLSLQRRAGNRTVLTYLDIQAKLEVGRVDDPLETEADAVATRVVQALRGRGGSAGTLAMSTADDEEPAHRLQRRSDFAVGPEGGEVDADAEQAINTAGGGGRALPKGTLRGMGMAFGADFSSVRVHEGPVASALNERLGARAFTRGSDIFFRDGLPDTSRADGQHLLAHELAHTVQQGAVRRVQRLFDGYYVVCKGNDPGATRIENDTQKPKRFYRTVASLSTSATKAKNQPFKFWSLYVDPEASTLPAKAVEPEDSETDDTAKPATTKAAITKSDVEDDDESDEGTKHPSKSGSDDTGTKKKKKKKKKKTGEAPPVKTPAAKGKTTATPAKAKEEPTGPPEEAWKATYRSTAPALGLKGAFLEQNLKYLEQQLASKHSNLENAVIELEAAWRDEFEEEDDAKTLEDTQAELRTAMPTWNGNAATVMASFIKMDSAIASAKLAVTHAKEAGKLGDDIGSEGLKDMLSVFTRFGAIDYAKEVGGTVRLRFLLVDKAVPAAVLKHYGADMMKGFVGAGPKMWTHLVTASLNSTGVVSGGHDHDVFRTFIKKKKYTITNDPFAPPEPDPDADEDAEPPPPVVVPTVYRVQYANESGVVLGTKTLIQNLTGTKTAWMARFEEAAWNALINERLSGGSFWGRDSQNASYDGYYERDAFEVDTMWPS
jgi:hypothetical protein